MRKNMDDIRTQADRERNIEIQKEYDRFYTGEMLETLTSGNATLNKRDMFYTMESWLKCMSHDGHIGALFGLRRTGKTVILHQIAAEFIKKGVLVAYATYRYKEHDFNIVFHAVKKLADEGYQLILLDEITRTEGFYDGAMGLSDDVCAKVIIVGTESLMLWWAMSEPLFGRTITAKTTSMRYREYKHIFPDSLLMDFMRYGGVLWDKEKHDDTPITVEGYLRTSVVENIKNSINLLDDWHTITDRDYLGHIEADALFNLLVAVCECGVQDAVKRRISANWGDAASWKLTQAHINLGNPRNDPRLKVIKDGLREFYMQVPNSEYEQVTVEILIKRLRSMGFLDEVAELRTGGAIQKTLVITQPYVKREFVRRNLSVLTEYAELGLEDTADKMESIAYGVILEDIVYFEARARYFDKDAMLDNVVKCREDNAKEIDVCIYKRDTNELMLFEVKLSKEKVKTRIDTVTGEILRDRETKKPLIGQDRWFLDAGFMSYLIQFYNATSVKKAVLYMGETDAAADENGICWVNVEEWLLNVIEL